jgi:hypothetical protein
VTWGKIDDHLDDDPRFIGIPLSAAGAYLVTMPRALRADDGGLIPASVVALYPHDAPTLLERGVWVAEADGAARVAPDLWKGIVMPADKRRALSAVRSQAARRGAAARWHSDLDGNGWQSDSSGCDRG